MPAPNLSSARWWAVALVLLVPLAGCLRPDPTLVQSQILAATDINPSEGGQASPVVVRLYVLRSSGVFLSADFFALYDRDQATLKEELLSREEFQMLPGGTQELRKEVPGDARFVGVLVAFRDLDGAIWRAAYPLQPQKSNVFMVSIGQRTVSVGLPRR